MKHYLKQIVLSLCFMTLCGCDLLDLINENVGSYEGQNSDGKACEVSVSFLPLPLGLCKWMIVTMKEEVAQNKFHTLLKKYCVMSVPAATDVKYKITEGDESNPRQIVIENETTVNLENRKPKSVFFINEQRSCLRLRKK